jgi:hypothetical protein
MALSTRLSSAGALLVRELHQHGHEPVIHEDETAVLIIAGRNAHGL